MVPTVPCEERDRLLTLYKTGVAHYSATINDLNLTRGKSSREEYDRLLSFSQDAWRLAENARLALDRHTEKHGC